MIRVEHIPLGPVTTIMTTIPSAHTVYTVARFGRPSHTAPDDSCGGASSSACYKHNAGSATRAVNTDDEMQQPRPAPKLSDAPTSSLPLSQHPDSRMPPTPPRRKPKLAPGSSIFTRLPVCSWLRPAGTTRIFGQHPATSASPPLVSTALQQRPPHPTNIRLSGKPRRPCQLNQDDAIGAERTRKSGRVDTDGERSSAKTFTPTKG
ncbi:hypothetical protein DFP72DRAFT_1084399 [Ephemerocybe angulata]|uniref:Uncharacterized protein n=1 Tax=Ephemerocybe angulata TaxID=980116 RepID=A0A8H6H6H5_9AGAR|nr:hypothetical protein DFP72DRAFT_1084399 [Tulosesus angulatus]